MSRQSKTVPLVVYEKGGERRVVGTATITTDETGFHISGKVIDPEMQHLVEKTTGGLSFTTEQKEVKDGR